MRLTEKKIIDFKHIENILQTTEICRISFALDNKPYVIPVNFAYANNALHIHTAPNGKKIDWIRKNNQVCFEMTARNEIVSGKIACDWTTHYQSIIGYGKAHIISNPEDKITGLNYLMKKYAGMENPVYKDSLLERMVIIRIEILELSGKESGFKAEQCEEC